MSRGQRGCGALISIAVVMTCSACKSGANDTSDAGPPSCGTIQTSLGPVASTADGSACSFLGIPYAAPPVGPNRWRPPQPAAAWTAPRESVIGSSCPQLPFPFFGAPSSDEDCLYLNVFVPNPPPAKPAPVMVFVHGGGFIVGAGSSPLYDGANLASATGAIVVTFNYRLGAFGFLSNAALRAEDASHPSAGNYGLEDQIAALEWVQANAASFGGDPRQVTLFGESAGGTSMFLHLVSPKSQGLFERVIVESGWAPYGSPVRPMSAADQEGAAFATALGCTDDASLMACLRGKSVTDVLHALPTKLDGFQSRQGADWLPVVDGDFLPDDPMKLFASGAFAKVPVLLGNNTNEGSIFLNGNTTIVDDPSYLAFEEVQYPGHGADVVAKYPPSSYAGSYLDAAAEAFTDGSLVCPTRRIARAIVAAGMPAYRYRFAHALTNFLIPNLGAFHASELLFVFGNPLGGTRLTDEEAPLSQTMMGYWGSFAAASDPNGNGRAPWPAYDAAHETDMVLDLTPSTEDQYKRDACDFWDSVY